MFKEEFKEFLTNDGTHIAGGEHYIFIFPNGWGASVIKTNFSYGGLDGLYELAILKNKQIDYKNPIANGNVRGYLKPLQVYDLLDQIRRFDNVSKNT